MFIHYETPLYQDMKLGRFTAASEYENLIEDRELIRLICEELNRTGRHSMKFEGFHDFISFHVWGTLPRDGEKMMSKLDKVIAEYAKRQDILSVIDPDSTFEIRSAY